MGLYVERALQVLALRIEKINQSSIISTPKSISREPKKKLGMYWITLIGSANSRNSAPAASTSRQGLRILLPKLLCSHVSSDCCDIKVHPRWL